MLAETSLYLFPRPHVEAGRVREADLHQASPVSERHVLPSIGKAVAFEAARAVAGRPTNVVGSLRRRTPAWPRDRPAPNSVTSTLAMWSCRGAGLAKPSCI